jgi:hypothetical protein
MDFIVNDPSNNFSLLHVFIASGTCLPNHWLSMKGGIHTQIHKFVKFSVEMGSVVIIYVHTRCQIGSGIQKLMREDRRIHGDHIRALSFLYFFQNKEFGLKMCTGVAKHGIISQVTPNIHHAFVSG